MEKKLYAITDSLQISVSTKNASAEPTSMNKPLRSIITLMTDRITALDPENQKTPNRESIQQAESISMEMSQIFSAIKDPLILVSKQGWPVLSNPAAKQLLGLDPTGRPIEKVMEKLKLTATNGVPVTYEDLPIKYALEGHVIAGERFSFIDQNDNARYCSISTYPLTLNRENTGAVVVIRDEAEISRHFPATDLERESFTLKAIFNSAPEAIVVVDENCQIIMSNPKARWLYQGEPTPRYPDAPPNDIIAHPLGRTVFRGEIIEGFRNRNCPSGQHRQVHIDQHLSHQAFGRKDHRRRRYLP
jgi:PAS domain-containing protein